MKRLEEELRRRLASREPKAIPGSKARPAAVLIPLILDSEGYKLLLTRRASILRRQPGDISFPGGAIDATDQTPLDAALRESEEEVGLKPSHVKVLGQMDERETVTGFRITPFVGAVGGPYPFRTNHEVAELIFAPLTLLLRSGAYRIEHRRRDSGALLEVYHFLYQDYDIWGITGRLIKELLDLLPRELSPR